MGDGRQDSNARDERLAAALRENLRRRKAQGRARGEDATARIAQEAPRSRLDGAAPEAQGGRDGD
jgi:hypothetical protein